MKPTFNLAASTLLLTTTMEAYAQGGSPGGVATWIVAGGGFLAGFAAGLLWCWLRCRARKEADRQDK
ncbi:hypothetical protein [Piscinibacter sp.]|uniref:hypothetical protein n=1 Tax=Piscinibacter sp. TaxID=1903157 RepID=UPI002F4084C6